MTIYNINVNRTNGDAYALEAYRGQLMIIVNTASKCGLRGQFKELEALYQEYKDKGLVVLGFPSNQFMNQEPGTSEEAAQFCQRDYGVSFPMHEIIDVNGDNAHPLFKHLKDEQSGILGGSIKWNFTKFLVDREGKVVDRVAPQSSPEKLRDKIEDLLNEKA